MELNNSDKAQVLAQALPYIQKYYNKVVVVKYGGNAMINEDLKAAVMSDIVLLSLVGIRIVLVHGGGPEITETLSDMGKESRFVGGCGTPMKRPSGWCRWFWPARPTRI